MPAQYCEKVPTGDRSASWQYLYEVDEIGVFVRDQAYCHPHSLPLGHRRLAVISEASAKEHRPRRARTEQKFHRHIVSHQIVAVWTRGRPVDVRDGKRRLDGEK